MYLQTSSNRINNTNGMSSGVDEDSDSDVEIMPRKRHINNKPVTASAQKRRAKKRRIVRHDDDDATIDEFDENDEVCYFFKFSL
jgi:hypothetical protein